MSTGRNGVLTAFAANQRDEVRDLHDVAAALTAQPGMKQQTFVAGITAKGNGDCFLSEERHTALSGGGGMPGQGYPAIFTAAFSAGAGASAGSIGYMSDRLLTIGNTTAALDELYVWLSDNVSVGTTIIEYIRNTLKRVRKKESNLIMASQNLEDFDREGIRELTKPLFAIPPHQFIFNCGSIDKRFYMDLLQLEEAEYNLIRFPQRGVCLFKCGNERYLLEVHAPAYKEALFGTAGGR